MKNTQILVPLSSDLAIVGGFELKPGVVIDIDPAHLAKINGSIILHAAHQVYAKDEEFGYLLRHHDGIQRGSNLFRDAFFGGRAEPARSAPVST
ncbi:hypothetical protein [Lichenihabitans psoromatis]|uniref:hypothetical protein n=1 Tax=Lichenihabitans psoromatis TaxID=2528642 RepID=UPI00103559E0|nr:hypothetical protein [Lichenihabitans psoromatis]